MSKYVVEINHRIIVAGTLEQCTKLLTLVGEMQTVDERNVYADESFTAVFPADVTIEMKRVSGRNRWADSKEAALEMERNAKVKVIEEEPAPADAF